MRCARSAGGDKMRLIRNAIFLARIKGPAAGMRYWLRCNRDAAVLVAAVLAVVAVKLLEG